MKEKLRKRQGWNKKKKNTSHHSKKQWKGKKAVQYVIPQGVSSNNDCIEFKRRGCQIFSLVSGGGFYGRFSAGENPRELNRRPVRFVYELVEGWARLNMGLAYQSDFRQERIGSDTIFRQLWQSRMFIKINVSRNLVSCL